MIVNFSVLIAILSFNAESDRHKFDPGLGPTRTSTRPACWSYLRINHRRKQKKVRKMKEIIARCPTNTRIQRFFIFLFFSYLTSDVIKNGRVTCKNGERWCDTVSTCTTPIAYNEYKEHTTDRTRVTSNFWNKKMTLQFTSLPGSCNEKKEKTTRTKPKITHTDTDRHRQTQIDREKKAHTHVNGLITTDPAIQKKHTATIPPKSQDPTNSTQKNIGTQNLHEKHFSNDNCPK